MGRYASCTAERGSRGKNCKMRKRLGWGWIEVPASKPLTATEIVYSEPPRTTRKKKPPEPKKRGYKPNSPGVSTIYSRMDKHMWAYGKSRYNEQ